MAVTLEKTKKMYAFSAIKVGMKNAKVIREKRGGIFILDRAGLRRPSKGT